jgi:hypothetical protein
MKNILHITIDNARCNSCEENLKELNKVNKLLENGKSSSTSFTLFTYFGKWHIDMNNAINTIHKR